MRIELKLSCTQMSVTAFVGGTAGSSDTVSRQGLTVADIGKGVFDAIADLRDHSEAAEGLEIEEMTFVLRFSHST